VLDRWTNIFFTLTLVFVFILYGNSQDHQQIIIGAVFAFALTVIAFLMNWLTLDGAVSAGITGTIAYGLGGYTGAAVILAFFISGSLLSIDIQSPNGLGSRKFRRDGSQVWSNGFWFSLWLVFWFQTGMIAFLVAAVTSIAAATSDTWATEIGGNRYKGVTRLITTGEKVEPGTDGGVSVIGSLSAIMGAAFIGGIFWILEQESSIYLLLIIAGSGFLGSLLDSYLGARFQDRQYQFPGLSLIGKNKMYINNNYVNWISAGMASVIGLILITIFNV
jgi:uncharacterized protein (TIGR00297 family)